MTENTFVSIQGSRIRLRDWQLEDLEAFKHWQQPGQKWQDFDAPYYRIGLDDSEELTNKLRFKIKKADFDNPRMRLAIADNKTNRLIGVVAAYWESKETNWLSIGLDLYDPGEWQKGLGFEAMNLWIDYLFAARPELVRLDLRTWSGNLGMIHLAKKLGFRQEACFRKARIVKGEYFDGLGFGILREEWKT